MTFMKLNVKTANNPISRWAKELNKCFFKEDMFMANRNMKGAQHWQVVEIAQWESVRLNMLNIISHQGNANQNHNDVSAHTCQDAHHNKEHSKCWLGRGGKGTLECYWWECKLAQPLWKTVWRFLRKLKTELPYDPSGQIIIIWKQEMTIMVNRVKLNLVNAPWIHDKAEIGIWTQMS